MDSLSPSLTSAAFSWTGRSLRRVNDSRTAASVSIEAVCYVIFFLVAINRRLFWLTCSALTLAGLYLIRSNANGFLLTVNIGRGLVGFFIGAMLAQALAAGYAREVRPVATITIAIFIATTSLAGLQAFPGGEAGINLTFALAIFPSVLALSLTVPAIASVFSCRPLTFLGGISYSIYLVHIPLQIAIVYCLKIVDITAPVTSPLFFLTYGALVIVAAMACYYLFEVPMRAKIRERYPSATAAVAATPPSANPIPIPGRWSQ